MDGDEVPGSNAVKGLHPGGGIRHAQEGSPADVDGEKAIALQACCGQQAESGTEVQKAWPGPSALGTIGEEDSSDEDFFNMNVHSKFFKKDINLNLQRGITNF